MSISSHYCPYTARIALHVMMVRALITLILVFTTCTVSASELGGLRVWTDPEKTRAVLDLDGRIAHKVFTLENPNRVVIDLQNTELRNSLDFNQEHAGIIKNVRQGNPDKNTLRIVLDLSEQVRLKSFLLNPVDPYGHRLVIDLFPKDDKKPGQAVKRVADIQQQNRNVVIAIDAGHGGEDPGALGPARTREKVVVLAIAKELKKVVDAEPGMEGVLIRTGDYFIPHRLRYEKARKHRADLFVSIHADAFTSPKVSGSSVYVLSQRGASSEFARRLADNANKSDLIGGVTLNDKDDMLASVLLDLSQSATMEASNEVAADILNSLKANVKTHKKIVGRANFLVLKSPDMPSVLVETAYISNPEEEKRLKTRAYQKTVAKAVFGGIKNYFLRSPPPGTWMAAQRKVSRHLVARGDTLGDIANRYQVSLSSLKRANNLRTDNIQVGKELVIPTG